MANEIHTAIEVTCNHENKKVTTYKINIDPYVKKDGTEFHDKIISIELNSICFAALSNYLTRINITKLKMLAAAHPDRKDDNPWFKQFKEYMTYLNKDMFESGLPEYPTFSKGYLEYVPRNKEDFNKLKMSWEHLNKSIEFEIKE